MDSSVSPKDEIWFLRVCHHISNAACHTLLLYRTKVAVSSDHFMELGSSLPHSQEPITSPYPSQIGPFLCPLHFWQRNFSFLVGLRTYQVFTCTSASCTTVPYGGKPVIALLPARSPLDVRSLMRCQTNYFHDCFQFSDMPESRSTFIVEVPIFRFNIILCGVYIVPRTLYLNSKLLRKITARCHASVIIIIIICLS